MKSVDLYIPSSSSDQRPLFICSVAVESPCLSTGDGVSVLCEWLPETATGETNAAIVGTGPQKSVWTLFISSEHDSPSTIKAIVGFLLPIGSPSLRDVAVSCLLLDASEEGNWCGEPAENEDGCRSDKELGILVDAGMVWFVEINMGWDNGLGTGKALLNRESLSCGENIMCANVQRSLSINATRRDEDSQFWSLIFPYRNDEIIGKLWRHS